MEFIVIFIMCVILGCVCAAAIPLVSTGVVAAFTAHPFLYLATTAVIFTGIFGLICMKFVLDR